MNKDLTLVTAVFLILCVYAIRKNTSKKKRKTLFIEDFYLSRGEVKRGT